LQIADVQSVLRQESADLVDDPCLVLSFNVQHAGSEVAVLRRLALLQWTQEGGDPLVPLQAPALTLQELLALQVLAGEEQDEGELVRQLRHSGLFEIAAVFKQQLGHVGNDPRPVLAKSGHDVAVVHGVLLVGYAA
jgi:hypothetical protein